MRVFWIKKFFNIEQKMSWWCTIAQFLIVRSRNKRSGYNLPSSWCFCCLSQLLLFTNSKSGHSSQGSSSQSQGWGFELILKSQYLIVVRWPDSVTLLHWFSLMPILVSTLLFTLITPKTPLFLMGVGKNLKALEYISNRSLCKNTYKPFSHHNFNPFP